MIKTRLSEIDFYWSRSVHDIEVSKFLEEELFKGAKYLVTNPNTIYGYADDLS